MNGVLLLGMVSLLNYLPSPVLWKKKKKVESEGDVKKLYSNLQSYHMSFTEEEAKPQSLPLREEEKETPQSWVNQCGSIHQHQVRIVLGVF